MLQSKVFVKHFSGAKAKCMKDYLKPSLRQNQSLFILHVRTINLKSENPSKEIAKEIMEMAVFLKSEAQDVSVSDIIDHTVNQELNLMAIIVNNHLAGFC